MGAFTEARSVPYGKLQTRAAAGGKHGNTVHISPAGRVVSPSACGCLFQFSAVFKA